MTFARADFEQVEAGISLGGQRQDGCTFRPGYRRHRADFLSVAQRVPRLEPVPGEEVETARERKHQTQESRCGVSPGQADLERSGRGKLLSPSRRRKCIEHVRSRLDVTERRTCRILGQPRTTQRRDWKSQGDEYSLIREIVDLASRFGRY